LIESSNNGILGFKKDLINCQNPSVLFSQLIETFINVILTYFKILINCLKRTNGFWQLIESSNNAKKYCLKIYKSSNNGILGFKIF
jgi:hypothetical protein